LTKILHYVFRDSQSGTAHQCEGYPRMNVEPRGVLPVMCMSTYTPYAAAMEDTRRLFQLPSPLLWYCEVHHPWHLCRDFKDAVRSIMDTTLLQTRMLTHALLRSSLKSAVLLFWTLCTVFLFLSWHAKTACL